MAYDCLAEVFDVFNYLIAKKFISEQGTVSKNLLCRAYILSVGKDYYSFRQNFIPKVEALAIIKKDKFGNYIFLKSNYEDLKKEYNLNKK